MAAQPIPAKKQGSGPTGCMVLFGLIFLAAGVTVAVLVLEMAHKGYRAHTVYLPAQAVILDKQLIESSDSDGTTYRAEFTFTFRANPAAAETGGDGVPYTVKGYDGTNVSSGRSAHQAILNQYQIGQTYTCWYDPEDPNHAVLHKPGAWNLLWLLFPIPFVGFGLFAIIMGIHGWRSRNEFVTPEKPSRATGKHPANASATGGEDPSATSGLEPGTKLAYSLKCETSEKVVAMGMGCFGTFWTGLTGFFWLQMLRNGEWLGVVFLGLFVLIGLGVLSAAFWQALIGWGVGATAVEVSADRVAPGQSFEVWISQSGRAMQVNRLSVFLVCEEKSTYRQGTNTQTDTHTVLEELQAERLDFAVSRGRPEEVTARVTIPAGAMHGFSAENNKILWKIVVKGNLLRWPDFKREFPLRVVGRVT